MAHKSKEIHRDIRWIDAGFIQGLVGVSTVNGDVVGLRVACGQGTARTEMSRTGLSGVIHEPVV